jgi:spoIIIJ-associated protein
MEMKRIEAETLEEAYSKAAKELSCSVTEINYEIVQHPTSGVLGLFKKSAIIIAVKKSIAPKEVPVEPVVVREERVKTFEPKTKVVAKVKEEKKEDISSKISIQDVVSQQEDKIVDNFFEEKAESKVVEPTQKMDVTPKVEVNKVVTESIEHKSRFDDDRENPKNLEISLELEVKIKKLMDVSCFDIDTVEVDVFNNTAHIFIDGEDAALLIGKEGYRYNALSYMLFNWINSCYNLYIKLEIAEFIQAQEEMIVNYLKPIAEHIKEHGKGKTKPLDGILVQIALEQLREMFPNKYIAIKTGKDGKKFIIINNFNSRKNG